MFLGEKLQMEDEKGFLDYFEGMEDPRIDRQKLHPMNEILLLTLCGIICGCDGWIDIETFGKAKQDFLKEYLPYENGIPSDDTLRRFFRALDPEQFQEKFIEWAKQLGKLTNKVIAVDGKTSRGSTDGSKKALHLVSAFASELGVVIGQQATAEKSNEITAIPALLQWLDITGAIVTIDAMGCQKSIAANIRDKQADYVLALKGNQGTLQDDVMTYFSETRHYPAEHHCIDITKGHGRAEERQCYVINDIEWLTEQHPGWRDLNSIIKVKSTRIINDSQSVEERYYISSCNFSAKQALDAIRLHWGVENQLHYVLDVSFNEDASQIRKGNAPQNMAILRHITINMIKRVLPKRRSIKGFRKNAGWDDSALASIIDQGF
jgi:predicted transposase YbfD/YdcC